jgi:predicted secreted protein
MQKYLSPLGAASVLFLAFFSSAWAATVTSADLSGKKICWDNGSVSTYNHGGKYSNNLSGEGTWSVTASGLQIHTERYDYVAIVEKLPDGTFHAVVAAAGINSTGRYCK